MIRDEREFFLELIGELRKNGYKPDEVEEGFKALENWLTKSPLYTEHELERQVQRYKNILSGTDAGTWEWNLVKHEGQFNDKWAEMLGYELEEFETVYEGRLWEAIVHPDDKPMLDRFTVDLLSNKTDFIQADVRLVHKNGSSVWVHARGRVTDWDANGNATVVSGAAIDITAKMIAEEKLLRAKEQLERSLSELSVVSQAKEDFLSTMSHEIRTPLNAVIGLSNLLLRRSPRPDQLEIVKTLKNSSDNLLHLVNDILDYNKIQAGKLQLESVRFDFREFIEHLYSTFKHDADDRGLEFKITADPQIPDTMEGDITRLNQIMINLLSNALKFTKEGTVSLEASLVSLVDGVCSIRFVVTDTGIGVPSRKLGKIFEPFNQSDASSTRQYGGTGLGLSIVKALVKMFDGSIMASSVPGKGSSFAVQIKLRESLAGVDAWKGNWELPFGKRQMRILYVEDVESNRFLVKHLMEEYNLLCTIADSGKEALEKTLVEKFDVILMDIQMPVMDGYQVAQEIVSQAGGKNNTTPIVAFTAEPVTESLRRKLSNHRMRDVISKPFDIDQFLEKISAISDAPEEDVYSFAFYKRATISDITKNIRKIVANEIQAFSVSLMEAYENKDITRMREEIHKLHPIIQNLKMTAVSELLEELRSYDQIDTMMFDIIKQIRKKIDWVAEDLIRTYMAQSSEG